MVPCGGQVGVMLKARSELIKVSAFLPLRTLLTSGTQGAHGCCDQHARFSVASVSTTRRLGLGLFLEHRGTGLRTTSSMHGDWDDPPNTGTFAAFGCTRSFLSCPSGTWPGVHALLRVNQWCGLVEFIPCQMVAEPGRFHSVLRRWGLQ